ncbi:MULTISPECIES: AbgT family transporter [Cytobacillus]|uniref:AbgT family transporter n=1 Tax=Cytobacillus TaxID=2675230 RepID=UPI0024801CDF|nr:AbgT family transporter [Cytobacillus kochii]
MKVEHEVKQSRIMTGFLNGIEKLGNKLPDPFFIFAFLAIVVIIASAIINSLNVTVVHPGTSEELAIKSLLSGEGIQFILTEMLSNFTGFAPLGLVLAMMLGVGLADKVGLLEAAIKKTMLSTPKSLVTYAVFFVGILGNIASDAAFVLIPPLAAMIFYTVGRHPLAGLAAGFAGVGAGFTANIIVGGTDALLAGITSEAAKAVDPSISVSPVDNWYFMSVSVVILTLIGGLITERIIEPRLGKYDGELKKEFEPVTQLESKALKNSVLAGVIYLIVLFTALFWPNSPLRNEEGGIIPSTFLSGIIPIILLFFIVMGTAYGVTVKKIQKSTDIPKFMGSAMKDMSGYIVLIFAASQFIAYFNWSNLGTLIAVRGADLLTSLNLTGWFVIILFVFFTAGLNLLIFSGSAQWALQAPIFVPMFMLLGFNPAFVQVAYRIADSSTNVITPLNPYILIILAYMKEYDKKAGLGTLISMMLPYSIAFLFTWVILLVLFGLLGIPFGPGVGMFL